MLCSVVRVCASDLCCNTEGCVEVIWCTELSGKPLLCWCFGICGNEIYVVLVEREQLNFESDTVYGKEEEIHSI